MHTTQSLEQLLSELFTPAELRRWLRGRSEESARLVDAIPDDPVAPAELAHQATRALVRFGLIDGTFFDDLVRERPAQAPRIRAVQSGWRAQWVSARARSILALAAPVLVGLALWLLSRDHPSAAPQVAPVVSIEDARPSPGGADQEPQLAPAASAPPSGQEAGPASTEAPPPKDATPDPAAVPAATPSSTRKTTTLSNSPVRAGGDANIEGDDITIERSPISAGQDVNIGSSP